MATTLIVEQHVRLGRHVEHDPRSRDFPVVRTVAPLKTVTHARHCPPYDQGSLGACTGNAMAGALMTEPLWKTGRELTEADAIRIYSEATGLDTIRGSYPPTDTGSSGLGVMKAAKKEGLLSGYRHAFGLSDLQHALMAAPGILGINWYDSFDTPLPTGECPLPAHARIRGGHEIQMFGLDIEQSRVWCYQSWGPTWGGLKNGTFWFSFATLERLLKEDGDATFGVPA